MRSQTGSPELMTPQNKQVWRARQKASPREALGEVEAQLCLSREDKGKPPLSFGSVAYASREAELDPQERGLPLASPNLIALIFSANSAPMIGVKGVSPSADSVAYTALISKVTNKVPSREAGTEALRSANYLCQKAKYKAPLRAKGEVTTTSLPTSSGAKFALGAGATSLASPSEANNTDEVISRSPVVKKRSFNVRVLQPEQPSTRSPRVSVLDHLSLVNPDL